MRATLRLLSTLAGASLSAQEPALQLDLAGEPRLRAEGDPLPAVLHHAAVREAILDLRDLRAHATFGPDARLGVRAGDSFALTVELRTSRGAFGTVLMCREGGAVHYSLTMGRRAGHVAFEPWSWTRDKLLSPGRLDDGRWHVLEAAYDAATGQLGLRVDGAAAVVQPCSSGFAGTRAPSLRMGHNLDPGVDQPFGGEVRRFDLTRRVPAWLHEALAAEKATTVLARSDVERALSGWLAHARRARPPQAASAKEWESGARRIRAGVQDALGLWPPPYAPRSEALAGLASPLSGLTDAEPTDFTRLQPVLPLAVREGGTLVRARHSVTRIYWQTFAGSFASGWLYRPRALEPGVRAPAMLCPHGHWAGGARHPVVQARCIAFAEQGYVVLAVDSVHLYDDRIGLSPLSVMTWNNLRGLELLRGRDDVDPARIGCTGASGGGQQTYYLTALDSGLAAAAPAVMACHFEDILGEVDVHCACNHTPHLVRAADMPQMAAAFAPKPQFFLTVSGDWTHRFHEHGFPAVAAVYGVLGAREAVAWQRWEKGHAYDEEMRRSAYAFFARALRVDGALEYAEPPGGVPTETAEALAALDLPEARSNPAAIVAEFHARLRAPDGRPADDVRASLRRLFEHADELAPPPARSEPARLGEAAVGELAFERWTVPTDGELLLPALVLRAPTDVSPARVAVLLGDGRGKSALLRGRTDFVRALHAHGAHVVLVDVRYTGELDLGRAWRDLYGRFFGLDEGMLAVRDLRRVLDALPALGFAPARTAVVGFGDRGAVALFAAALDERIAVVGADALGADYAQGGRAPAIGRVLLHGDLSDARALAGERALIDAACTSDAVAEALGR